MKRLLILFLAVLPCAAGVFNLRVVTDGSPDYTDLESLIWSATSRWETEEEKCWALFYWNHKGRRQTTPMEAHGMAVTDPIRQFNDYGFTMCSTIAGVNCSLWHALGLKSKYWDISNHTVSEVEYGGRWHLYDNSMTAIYTLCDGKTLAGVEEIGKAGACPASGGVSEPGHVAKYHCLTGTSPKGFLTGADTIRSLDEEYRCFNPNGLKYRSYFYDWDRGHRYIFNLRNGQTYTRHYQSLGDAPEFYVPNHGKDPESPNRRYRLRGNGVWSWKPELNSGGVAEAYSAEGIEGAGAGLQLAAGAQKGNIVYRLDGANILTSARVKGIAATQGGGAVKVSIQSESDRVWREIWKRESAGEGAFEAQTIEGVNGAHSALIRVELEGQGSAVRDLEIEAITMLNSKTQPKLNWGRNEVYVGAGEQTESIVLWPELQNEKYKKHAVAEENIASAKEHPGYMAALYKAKPKADSFVIFRADAPRPIRRIQYGGRFYNRAPGSQIEMWHSFDEGKSWAKSYVLTNTAQPWDVIHYETVEVPERKAQSVLFKYVLKSSEAGAGACGLYAARMEVHHEAAPIRGVEAAVTFAWKERETSGGWTARQHTKIVRDWPTRYFIDVGGEDHPQMESLRMAPVLPGIGEGYSRPGQGQSEKFIGKWITLGTNWALGKTYTVSVPSFTNWGAGDPEGRKLTDGVVGPPYPGGTAPMFALGWNKGQAPVITVDLGESRPCGAFRLQIGAGWPWWEAFQWEIEDKAEVWTSADGKDYQRQGEFDFRLRMRDMPVNHFYPDEEKICGHPFEVRLAEPVQARFVQFRLRPERSVTVSEVQVFDRVTERPFDLKIALPR